MTPTIHLTKRQHALLYMDVVEVGTTPDTRMLAAELMVGRIVHVTGVLMAELAEFCDRDQDSAERQVYRRIRAKAKAALEAAAS